MGATANNAWQSRVKTYLRQGFGAEDIAVKVGCRPQSIRLEISILRQIGVLDKLYRAARLDWREEA